MVTFDHRDPKYHVKVYVTFDHRDPKYHVKVYVTFDHRDPKYHVKVYVTFDHHDQKFAALGFQLKPGITSHPPFPHLHHSGRQQKLMPTDLLT